MTRFQTTEADLESIRKERERKDAWYNAFHEGPAGWATFGIVAAVAAGGEAFGGYKLYEASPEAFYSALGIAAVGLVLGAFATIPVGPSEQQEKDYKLALGLGLPVSRPFILGNYAKEGLANLPYAIPDRPRRKR